MPCALRPGSITVDPSHLGHRRRGRRGTALDHERRFRRHVGLRQVTEPLVLVTLADFRARVHNRAEPLFGRRKAAIDEGFTDIQPTSNLQIFGYCFKDASHDS